MSRYSIVLIDNEHGIKYHLSDFERMYDGGWNKFSTWFKFSPTQFYVAGTTLSKYSANKISKIEEKVKNETKRRTNKTKKSKKPARKG